VQQRATIRTQSDVPLLSVEQGERLGELGEARGEIRQQRIAAIQAETGRAAETAEERAGIEAKTAEELAERTEQFQSEQTEARGRAREFQQETSRIAQGFRQAREGDDRTSLERTFGGGAGILFAGIASALGGFAARLTGTANSVQQQINRLVDDNIEQQREQLAGEQRELAQRETVFGQMQEALREDERAFQASRAFMLDEAANEVAIRASESQSPEIQARGAELERALRDDALAAEQQGIVAAAPRRIEVQEQRRGFGGRGRRRERISVGDLARLARGEERRGGASTIPGMVTIDAAAVEGLTPEQRTRVAFEAGTHLALRDATSRLIQLREVERGEALTTEVSAEMQSLVGAIRAMSNVAVGQGAMSEAELEAQENVLGDPTNFAVGSRIVGEDPVLNQARGTLNRTMIIGNARMRPFGLQIGPPEAQSFRPEE
jgi:hypothetical protein